MSKDVEFELTSDGELIVKRGDARDVIEAMRRAVAKNSDNDRPEAFDPDADEDDDEDDDEETAAELSPRERARRRRQLAENARESGRLESTSKLLKGHPMISADYLIEQVNKAGLGFAMVKRFVEKAGSDELTEHQVTALLMGAWGLAEFGKRFQAQDAEGRIARQAVAKARDAAFTPTILAIGERALAAATQPRGERSDPLRERIIRDKAVGSPFLSQEQLAAYADAMIAELERTARGKQERARPGGGTLENV
jgi:hypothetical protein